MPEDISNEEFNERLMLSECFNVDLEGVFKNAEGNWCLDRRLTSEAAEKRGLTPRTADLNLMGSEIVELSQRVVAMLKLDM